MFPKQKRIIGFQNIIGFFIITLWVLSEKIWKIWKKLLNDMYLFTIQFTFLLYFSCLFSIQLGFPPYFSYLFTIQLIFLPYFPYLFTFRRTFLPYFPYHFTFHPYFPYHFTIFFCIFKSGVQLKCLMYCMCGFCLRDTDNNSSDYIT
jgi:hypothetical protein